jgi:serine beta-lactamase-like protein LACTB, mitochondrial
VQTYVAAFPKKQWPVRLRDVMAHTAGLGEAGAPLNLHCESPAGALEYVVDEALRFEPGSKYAVSHLAWTLMSGVVEVASKRPFAEFMQDAVFDRAGMRDTVADNETMYGEDFPGFIAIRERIFDPQTVRGSTNGAHDRAASYYPRYARDPRYGLHMLRLMDTSCAAGANVFLSTPTDLVRFGLAMQAGRLLKRETAERMQASQRLASGAETGHGLGWDMEKTTGAVGIDGDVWGGQVASLWIVKDKGVVVAVTSNISYADTSSLAKQIAAVWGE